ncbi:histone-lysine N-methyltransferase PR-Set7 [Anopheles ziemanni]|uniref:histone-lysine N-methyltransferase PR-Set7 n=1 Tax=Anopheles coustani TaxID=139045 RepID=UPI002659523F|nr:histone-lysine N-methyltransferase PR-Set7 [Anopheles coustani]XP_058176918.1 histone-lysine N-methyltransferase PR-Set7 [Anopheles ziemanni]
MIKGRRTRHAGKSSIPNSTKPNLDDTASPKRKDSKHIHKDQASPATAHLNKKHLPQTPQPMMLRGGRLKNVDITCYLQPTDHLSSVTVVAHPKADTIIDITDENACNLFTEQSSHALEASITKVHTLAGTQKTSSFNNNNIFLQEPVLSLNLDKTATDQSNSRKIMPKSFLENASLKANLFSSLTQTTIDSLWKNDSVTGIYQNNNIVDPPNDLTKSLEQHALDLSKPTQVTHIDSTTATAEMFHHDDSNSCDSGDSGVVIISSNDGTTSSVATEDAESNVDAIGYKSDSAEKRRKPATPHRILCPSPVKHAVVCSATFAIGTKSMGPGGNKKLVAASNKTRKRLNVDDAENSLECQVTGPLNDSNQHPVAQGTSEMHHAHNDLDVKNRGNKFTVKQRDLTVEPLNGKVNSVGNKKITEFYPVRRSVRKTKKEVQVERDRDIEHAIQEEREEGLKIQHFEGKGRGVVTTRPFCKGEFVVEYIGDLISVSEAKQREQIYAEDDNTGCYMYYFKHKNLQHCIDATAESGKLGRLVNHSRNGNLVTKTVSLNNRPHLVLIAKEDIEAGVEVTYDYGDRSKEALQYYPWLAL